MEVMNHRASNLSEMTLLFAFLRTEMMPDPSTYYREYSSDSSYSLFQFEGSDVISVPKNSIL